MKTRALVVIALILAATQTHSQETSESVLYGTWQDIRQEGCTEIIRFTDRGTIHVQSGEEMLEGTIVVEQAPGEPFALRVVRTINKSNGQPDCEGRRFATTGTAQPAFALFDGPKTMRLCADRLGQWCFGRFSRTQ